MRYFVGVADVNPLRVEQLAVPQKAEHCSFHRAPEKDGRQVRSMFHPIGFYVLSDWLPVNHRLLALITVAQAGNTKAEGIS